jgi:hypothetical protein
VSTSTARPADVERWTIVSELGSPVLAYDALTRDEAVRIVLEDSHCWQGGPFYAVPESLARRLHATAKAIEARHVEASKVERELAVRVELGLLADEGLDVEPDELAIRYAGPGRGYFVTRRYMLEGFARTVTLAGPFTTREAAAERIAAELGMRELVLGGHSIRVAS